MDVAAQALVDALNQVRLDEDYSYAQLAQQIGVDPGGLHKLLNGKSEQPYDRTLFKVRRFLEKRDTTKRPPARKTTA